MDDTSSRLFFLQPADDTQRLYEALRAVFVEGQRQKDVAQRFGFRFDAFRQQVLQFRAACASGQPPPFSAHERAADLRPRHHREDDPNSQPLPTAAP